MFSVGSVLELSDNLKYVVAGNAELGGKVYYYLIGLDDYSKVKFCVADAKQAGLVEVFDAKLVKKLAPLFEKSSKEFFDAND